MSLASSAGLVFGRSGHRGVMVSSVRRHRYRAMSVGFLLVQDHVRHSAGGVGLQRVLKVRGECLGPRLAAQFAKRILRRRRRSVPSEKK